MIFLPNNFFRFLSALRNDIQSRILRKGILKGHLRLIEKITLAEAAFAERCPEPADIAGLSSRLLQAVYIKLLENGRRFSFSVSCREVFLIDKKGFTVFLLLLCRSAEGIFVYSQRGKLVIKAMAADLNACRPLTKVLNIRVFKELKTNTAVLIIPATKTEKKAGEDLSVLEYLADPLSTVNVFLSE